MGKEMQFLFAAIRRSNRYWNTALLCYIPIESIWTTTVNWRIRLSRVSKNNFLPMSVYFTLLENEWKHHTR